jgi:hypothetical protein
VSTSMRAKLAGLGERSSMEPDEAPSTLRKQLFAFFSLEGKRR